MRRHIKTEDVREKLAILVASGKAKEMVGKALTHDDIKRMSPDEVKKYAKRYETAMASRTTDTLADSFLKLTTKLVGMALPIGSIDDLHSDLHSDLWKSFSTLRSFDGPGSRSPARGASRRSYVTGGQHYGASGR